MARGRKKGGLKINSLTDKTEITNMIINQINSLNKKIKAFKNKGIEEHSEYIHNMISDDMGQFTKNGTLSKSKKFYDGKNMLWLKKTLSALHKINNNDLFGTVHKYETEVTDSLKKVRNYVEDYLQKKGYSKEFINEVINNKDFYARLFMEFNNVGGGYGSNQAIEKVALNYENTGLDTKETERILSNIEYSKNVLDRIKDEQEAFEEFKRNRRMR